MTAWSNLIAGSTAPPLSSAWTHLLSQGGGGGTVVVQALTPITLEVGGVDVSMALSGISPALDLQQIDATLEVAPIVVELSLDSIGVSHELNI